MTQALIWFVVAVLAGIFEIITVDLVSIWIAVGALVAALLAAFKIPFIYQLIAVLVVSVGLGFITRPYCKKILRGNIIIFINGLIHLFNIIKTNEVKNI